ncbi:polysaccharide biosynthesis/export family protein [Pseudorhizobium flavum]|jgi:polysaccharide export outer membrane protein|uniref:Polysaccharide export outer membrane protein n=1 Tax=Pseudorhizobium flavum TaxID=1335061 RepID=A0A7W9YVF5_9HYPH|nr:polysaccharide biosynthesis/export family protein [Pseudorhizobium flavum]MBB6179142.1 polysaccharide export outer membrane protein [Pseudorhizobium flavum]CAD6603544.1 sugar ABC transporter substrate-binding protein [Pseudorhizobium flavum]
MSFASRKSLTTVALVSIATALAACSTSQPTPKSFDQAAVQPYRLDSGDRLRITVFEQPGLSNTYTVDQAGYIAFPLIGQVAARGETLPALEGAIATRLKQGYLRDPDVTIEVDRYRPVFVMGEVGRPGQYSYVPGMTAQNAIAIAGGFTPRGNQRDVDVTRKINGRVFTGRTEVSSPVLAGDTIHVRERLF